jgi:hypothetical protein
VVKVDLLVQEEAPGIPGQRCFSAVVPASGAVQVIGSRLLRRVFVNDFRVKFAEGAPLGPQAKETEAGLWLINCESSTRYLFFVGTQAEFQNFHPSRIAIGDETKTSGGKKGGGRGRGGRHGGQSSDSNSDGATP